VTDKNKLLLLLGIGQNESVFTKKKKKKKKKKEHFKENRTLKIKQTPTQYFSEQAAP